jgi:uncharacterized protein YkwD
VPTIAPSPVKQDASPTVAEQEAVSTGAVDSLEPQKLQTSETQIFEDLPSGATLADQMLAENNRIRAAAGKPPQILDPRLCQAAQEQAEYLARTHYFDHYVNGTPRTRAARYGFPVRDANDMEAVKENIAGGFQSLENAFNGWVHSSGHYETMLENRPLCGFGVAKDKSRWVALYGDDTVATKSRQVSSFLPQVPLQSFPTGRPAQQPRQYVPQTRRGLFGRRW